TSAPVAHTMSTWGSRSRKLTSTFELYPLSPTVPSTDGMKPGTSSWNFHGSVSGGATSFLASTSCPPSTVEAAQSANAEIADLMASIVGVKRRDGVFGRPLLASVARIGQRTVRSQLQNSIAF